MVSFLGGAHGKCTGYKLLVDAWNMITMAYTPGELKLYVNAGAPKSTHSFNAESCEGGLSIGTDKSKKKMERAD